MNRKSRFVENITTEPYLWKRMLAGFIDYSIIIIFFSHTCMHSETNKAMENTESMVYRLYPH